MCEKSPALFADLFVSPVRSVSVCLARSELRVGGLTGDDWSLGAEPRVSRSVCLTCNPPRLKGHSAALILPYPLSQSLFAYYIYFLFFNFQHVFKQHIVRIFCLFFRLAERLSFRSSGSVFDVITSIVGFNFTVCCSSSICIICSLFSTVLLSLDEIIIPKHSILLLL